MKVDSLQDGAPDCPLIRLYCFTQNDIAGFHQALYRLANENLTRIALPNELDLDSMNRCALALVVGQRDKGICKVGPQSFECVHMSNAWDNMAGLVEPFCRSASRGFQWLHEKSEIKLLLTHDGLW